MHIGPPMRPPPEPKPGELYYRLYFFNGGTHITTTHEFFAAGDEEAVKIAEGWHEGRKMELWQRTRVVSVWSRG